VIALPSPTRCSPLDMSLSSGPWPLLTETGMTALRYVRRPTGIRAEFAEFLVDGDGLLELICRRRRTLRMRRRATQRGE
jgi:hypothetical protein